MIFEKVSECNSTHNLLKRFCDIPRFFAITLADHLASRFCLADNRAFSTASISFEEPLLDISRLINSVIRLAYDSKITGESFLP